MLFVVFGKEKGFEYSVQTERGEPVCTCAFNRGTLDQKRKMAKFIAETLNDAESTNGEYMKMILRGECDR